MEKVDNWIDNLDPVKLVEHDRVKSSFINAYMSINNVDETNAIQFYEKESRYYKKAVSDSDKLKTATKISLYSAFLECAINGISAQPGQKSEAYYEARGINIGTKDRAIWQNIASLVLSAYGELNMRIKAGQIVRMANPQVLYEGDYFQPQTNARGELFVDYKPSIPRKSQIIFGCYVAIYLPHDHIDFKWLLLDDIKRLKDYSKGKNTNPNALYKSFGGQIDPGFLETKTIKHAMRSYTRLKISDSVAMEGDLDNDADTDESFGTPQQKAPTVTYGNGNSQDTAKAPLVPADTNDEVF